MIRGNYCRCRCHEEGSQMMHAFACCAICLHCREDRILDLRDHLACCTQYLFHYDQGETPGSTEARWP